MRAKKTPMLDFRPDEVIRAAERIDEILRGDPSPTRPVSASDRASVGCPRLMARRRPPTVHGVAVVDKPAGRDEPRRRRACCAAASASGASATPARSTRARPACSSSASARHPAAALRRRRSQAYTGEVVLGVETDTLDADGAVVRDPRHGRRRPSTTPGAPSPSTSPADIEQVPPMVSAIQVDGRRLHELAREGIEVERAPRPVTVAPLRRRRRPDDPVVLAIEVECSSGTYVRTLAADLGHLLGGGAHLRNLRRTAVGPFTIDEAASARRVRAAAAARRVRGMPTIDVDARPRRIRATAACSPAPRRRGAVGDGRSPTARCSPSTSRSTARPSAKPAGRARRRAPGSVAAVEVITDVDPPPWPGERTVVTIGAYDGVHLGHQAVIEEVKRLAAEPTRCRSCSRSTGTRRRSCAPSRRRSC